MKPEPRYETIRPRTERLGSRLVHLTEIASTMDEARRLALEGAPEGTVVVADRQTGGRGRLGRSWFSAPGSLLATVVLRPAAGTQTLSLVPLAAGLSLARAIEKLLQAPARIKWPNDLWIEGRKVGGILVESRFEGDAPDYVLVGLGVNGDVRADEFPPELREEITSLSAWAGRHVCMPALLKIFLEDFEHVVDELWSGVRSGILDAVALRSAILHQQVRVETAAGPVEGTATHLGPGGELGIETESGNVLLAEGDCRLLRISGVSEDRPQTRSAHNP